MSADFWAGYISGAAGIVIGNPLDVLKVRLQAFGDSARTSSFVSSGPQPHDVAGGRSISPSQRVTGKWLDFRKLSRGMLNIPRCLSSCSS